MATTIDIPASATNLQIRITGGGFRPGFRLPGSPRLTRAEKEALAAQMSSARELALSGNDAALRGLTQERFVVECVSNVGSFGAALRRRKFSNPLFLTPDGLLQSFPEDDKELFATQDVALDALKKQSVNGEWEIRQTSLANELRDKRYLRWVREVKGREYQEPRRTQAELAVIYENGGIGALLAIYSKAHAFKIAKRLNSSF